MCIPKEITQDTSGKKGWVGVRRDSIDETFIFENNVGKRDQIPYKHSFMNRERFMNK